MCGGDRWVFMRACVCVFACMRACICMCLLPWELPAMQPIAEQASSKCNRNRTIDLRIYRCLQYVLDIDLWWPSNLKLF